MDSVNKSKAGRIWILLWLLCSLGGLTLWIIFVSLGWRSIWLATMTNFIFFFSLASGLFMWTTLLKLCRSHWADRIEYRCAAAIGFAIPSLIFIGILWAGAPNWAPWPGKHFPSGSYLDTSFLFGRDLFIIAAFWLLSFIYVCGRFSENAAIIAGWLAFLYTIGFSFLSIDLVEALEPPWKSALFGPYFFLSALYAGVVFWTLSSVRIAKLSVFHDLGKLITAFSLLTLYAFYCQFLTIWYENITSTTTFVIPRFNYDWKWISFALVTVLNLGPLVMLLSRNLKMNRVYVSMVCALLLLMLWIQSFWWVVPSLIGKHIQFGISYGASGLFIGGIFMLSYTLALGKIENMYLQKGKQA